MLEYKWYLGPKPLSFGSRGPGWGGGEVVAKTAVGGGPRALLQANHTGPRICPKLSLEYRPTQNPTRAKKLCPDNPHTHFKGHKVRSPASVSSPSDTNSRSSASATCMLKL